MERTQKTEKTKKIKKGEEGEGIIKVRGNSHGGSPVFYCRKWGGNNDTTPYLPPNGPLGSRCEPDYLLFLSDPAFRRLRVCKLVAFDPVRGACLSTLLYLCFLTTLKFDLARPSAASLP